MRYLLTLFFVSSLLIGFAQNNIENLVSTLNHAQEERLKNIFSDQRDSAFTAFDSVAQLLFSHPQICDLQINETYKYFIDITKVRDDSSVYLAYAFINNIGYCKSPDQKITAFSWDVLGGGCGHDYVKYFSLKENNTCHTFSDSISEYTSTGIYKIIQFKESGTDYYLFFGFGTSCGNSQYKTVQVFTIEKGELKELGNCFPEEKYLTANANRFHVIEISFDPKTLILKYPEFLIKNNSGFYSGDFEWKYLKFEKGKFTSITK
jgi:hypothetical protein